MSNTDIAVFFVVGAVVGVACGIAIGVLIAPALMDYLNRMTEG